MLQHYQFDEALAKWPEQAQQKFVTLEVLFSHSDTCAEKVRDRMIEVDEVVTSVDRRLARGGIETEEAERLTQERDAARIAYTGLVRLRDAHLATKGNARTCLRQLHDFVIALADTGIGVRPVDTADVHLIEEGTTLRQSLKRVRLEVEKAIAEIMAAREADNPPTTAQVWTDAKLLGRLLLLEAQEENLVSAAIAVGGVEVQRRPGASGWSLLGILPAPSEHMEAA